MGRCMLWLLALVFPVLVSSYRVTGSVGDNLVLPCAFSDSKEKNIICWGRGDCSTHSCNNPIAKTGSDKYIWMKSNRYEFIGNTEEGQATLKITDVTLDDSGTYCCRVRTIEPGYDIKFMVELEIQNAMAQKNLVRGAEDTTITLPCNYATKDGRSPMCWGRGSCPVSGCQNKILSTDGEKVTSSESERYQLHGNILNGDVSLTINGVFKEDEGTYCCRVEIPGLFNDIKENVELMVEDVTLVKGSLGRDLSLPCSYAMDAGTRSTCWGKGHCRLLHCHDKVLTTDGKEVNWRKSDKYQLKENIEQGNVSLTINRVDEDDGGVYCCRVHKPGTFNDFKKQVRLQITETHYVKGLVGDTVKLPCSYNVSEGTTKMCWGRGQCPRYKCSNSIVRTDGDTVTWTESEKYRLKGNLEKGDVSLSIFGVTKEDEGDYCCRVEIPGLFNDKIKEISLEVQKDVFG